MFSKEKGDPLFENFPLLKCACQKFDEKSNELMQYPQKHVDFISLAVS